MEWKTGIKILFGKVLVLLNICVFLIIIMMTIFWAKSILIKMDRANVELKRISIQLSLIANQLGHQRQPETIIIPVAITAYSPTPDQCDSTPFITASNQKVRTGIIALSRDIEKEFNLKFGDQIEIIGLGIFSFQDRMHRRWKRKVDIFFWEREEAIQFGKRRGKIRIKKET